jgi:hypothetical protein
MKKTILLAAVVLVAVGAGAAYFVWMGAEKDTKEITTLQDDKMTKEQVGKLKEKKAGNVKEALAAAEAAKELGTDDQLKIWETQLSSSDAPVRLKALQELSNLHGQFPTEVEALVKKVAADDADEDVKMMAEMLLEEWAGGGEEEAEGDAE